MPQLWSGSTRPLKLSVRRGGGKKGGRGGGGVWGGEAAKASDDLTDAVDDLVDDLIMMTMLIGLWFLVAMVRQCRRVDSSKASWESVR